MKKFRFLMPVLFLLVIAALSAIVMLLWNWLIPAIFGLAIINFWQALGLFILARILFGGFPFGRKGMLMNDRIHHMEENPVHEKWKNMTPEQRWEFIEQRRRFGFGTRFGRGLFNKEEREEQGKDNE